MKLPMQEYDHLALKGVRKFWPPVPTSRRKEGANGIQLLQIGHVQLKSFLEKEKMPATLQTE